MLMNGLAATMSASIILPNFDGQKNTVAQAAKIGRKIIFDGTLSLPLSKWNGYNW
jgi:hypothetical protein